MFLISAVDLCSLTEFEIKHTLKNVQKMLNFNSILDETCCVRIIVFHSQPLRIAAFVTFQN